MALRKVFVMASEGDLNKGEVPPPDQNVIDLVARMRKATPNWGVHTANPDVNARQLFAMAHTKYSLARGLPPGYRVNWNYAGHTIHPDNPNRWIPIATPDLSLRFEVTIPDGTTRAFFVMFDQMWAPAPAPATWEEPDQIQF